MKKPLLCLTAVICFSLLNIACNDDESTECRNLFGAQQYSEALPFCEKACNQNSGDGCFFLGFLYYIDQGYQQAKTYFEKACNLNVADGCLNIGNYYYNGYGVRQDLNEP